MSCMFCAWSILVGGLESRSQEAALRKNPDIIVATPGRLVDHLHNAPSFSLQNIEILVLDEADRCVCVCVCVCVCLCLHLCMRVCLHV